MGEGESQFATLEKAYVVAFEKDVRIDSEIEPGMRICWAPAEKLK